MRHTLTIFILSAALLLGGCGVNPRLGGGPPPDKRVAEKMGWKRVTELSVSECGASAKPPKPEEAVEVSRCIDRLVRRYVLPNAVSPQLVVENRAEAMEQAQDYRAGQLTTVQYSKKAAQRRQKYEAEFNKLTQRELLQKAADMWTEDRKI